MDKIIGFIGAGNMNSAIIGGLIKSGEQPSNIIVSNPSPKKLEGLAKDYSIITTTDNIAVAQRADVIVLGVKPHFVETVCEEIAEVVKSALIISVAAGKPITNIASYFGVNQAIIRAMPNTPSLVGKGATGICLNNNVSKEQALMAESIFATIGITEIIEDESLMDVVTALSGSGPAYFFYVVEAMLKEAQNQGMSEVQAKQLIYQTINGAAEMLQQSDFSAAELRQKVTSPGGTTAAAIESLDDNSVSEALQKAVAAAVQRGKELAQ